MTKSNIAEDAPLAWEKFLKAHRLSKLSLIEFEGQVIQKGDGFYRLFTWHELKTYFHEFGLYGYVWGLTTIEWYINKFDEHDKFEYQLCSAMLHPLAENKSWPKNQEADCLKDLVNALFEQHNKILAQTGKEGE